MTSQDLKKKQYQSLIRRRTSSAYGTKPVDNLYKKTDKLQNPAATRNFDPNIGSNISKPQAKTRLTNLSSLLQDSKGGTVPHKQGDPARKRLDSLNSRTTTIINIDKADNEVDHTGSHGLRHGLTVSSESSEWGGLSHHAMASHRYHNSHDSFSDDADSHLSHENGSFKSPDSHYQENFKNYNYQEKLETSSKIRERLDNLTGRADRLLKQRNVEQIEPRSRRSLISHDSDASDVSPIKPHEASISSKKQSHSHPRSRSSSPILIPDPSSSKSPSPARSVSLEPDFSKVQDCDGKELDVKECGLSLFPKVRHALKSFHYRDQKIYKRTHRRIHEIAVSLNGLYIYIGWRHPSLDLVPVNKFVINIDTQLKDFSFANESFIIQLTLGLRFIIASHYGRDDEIRQYFTSHPNPKVRINGTLTEGAKKRVVDRASKRSNATFTDPLVNTAFRRPRRSIPKPADRADDGIEVLGNYDSDGERFEFFDDTDYDKYEPIPDFEPELRYKYDDGTEIVVNESDFRTLHRNNWVDDVIIDFGLKYIVQEGVKKGLVKRSEIHSFNSFFFTKLISGSSSRGTPDYYNNIKRWLAKIDLMKLNYLIIPVNTSLHWYCCIVRNLPALLELAQRRKSDDNEPIDIEDLELENPTNGPNQYAEIFVLDSLGSKRYNVSVPIKSFIIDYCKEKHNVEINRDQIRFQSAKIPRQNNFNDCGVHVLYNIRKWLNNISECESFFKKHLQTQARVIFPAEERRNERKYWFNLLLELHRAQNDPHEDVTRADTVAKEEEEEDDDIEIVQGSSTREAKSDTKGALLKRKYDQYGEGSTIHCEDHKSKDTFSSESLVDLDIEEVANDNQKRNARGKKENKQPDQGHFDDEQCEEANRKVSIKSQIKHLPQEIHTELLLDTASNGEVHNQIAADTKLNQDDVDEATNTDSQEDPLVESLTLKNLALREQFKDCQLYPALYQLLNQYYPDEDMPIKGVRLIVVKKHISKAIDDPTKLKELETLLRQYASHSSNEGNQSGESAGSGIMATSRKKLSRSPISTNRNVTDRIENLHITNNHFDIEKEATVTGKLPPLLEFEEWKRKRKQTSNPHSKELDGFSKYGGNLVTKNVSSEAVSKSDADLFNGGGCGHHRFDSGDPGKSGFGNKHLNKGEHAEYYLKKKAARDVVEADGYDTAAHSIGVALPSDDSDVILDYPHSPFKKRKLS